MRQKKMPEKGSSNKNMKDFKSDKFGERDFIIKKPWNIEVFIFEVIFVKLQTQSEGLGVDFTFAMEQE